MKRHFLIWIKPEFLWLWWEVRQSSEIYFLGLTQGSLHSWRDDVSHLSSLPTVECTHSTVGELGHKPLLLKMINSLIFQKYFSQKSMKYFWTPLAKNILLSNNQIFLTEIKTDTSTACFAHCAMCLPCTQATFKSPTH